MKHLLVIFFLLPIALFSQGEKDWWYFGFNAGLHFVANNPLPQTDGQLHTNEGCATISDANGTLLFYTDGITVWNRNHNIMANGTDLKGNSSSTMSSMCIPLPGVPNIYYIFTTPALGTEGLYYSVVDLNLNGGNGAVISNKKNIQLMPKTCEKVTAVKNSSNTGYWVLAHNYPGDEFYAFELTTTGINLNPVITVIGTSIPANNGIKTIGYMKFSPLGNKLAVAYTFMGNSGLLQVFDFDANTGTLSGNMSSAGDGFNVYGIEFSKNGDYLYVSTNVAPSKIYQIQMDTVPILNLIHVDSTHSIGSLQMGPDNKIYVAVKDAFGLDVIHNPELAGIACNYQAHAIPLSTDTYLSLPNFVQGIFIPPNLAGTQACIGETIMLTGAVIPFATTYQWAGPNAFLSPQIYASLINISATDTGDYYFSAFDIDGNTLFRDTVRVTVYPNYQQTQQDTFCKGTTYTLPDGTQTSIGGLHTIGFQSIYGCDSIILLNLYEQSPTLNLGSDETICEGDSITFAAPNGFLNYLWNGNPAFNQATFTASEIGSYWIKVQDALGCFGQDSIAIKGFHPKPQGFLPRDTSLCEAGEKISLKIIGFLSYLWNDGSNSNTFVIQDTGTYSLMVENSFHCFGKDEIHIRQACPLEIYIPNAFSPNEDGTNDSFFVTGQGIDFLELKIFDAWGRLIEQLNAPQATWDGYKNGKALPEGVYTYKVKAWSNFGQSISRSGTITLIR